MPYFYHYTDEEGAKHIIRTGKILASLSFMAGGDTVAGNGVYFTKLAPGTSSRTEIAMNNWTKTSPQYLNKTDYYFVLVIPESEIETVAAQGRSIFKFGRRSDLRLEKYPWWLKRYGSGPIIASYKYRITSLGPASKNCGFLMDDYLISEETVNGKPVYKTSDSRYSLFMSGKGNWLVGTDAGRDAGILQQISNHSLGPDLNLPWNYVPNNGQLKFKDDDHTLKADAWQM